MTLIFPENLPLTSIFKKLHIDKPISSKIKTYASLKSKQTNMKSIDELKIVFPYISESELQNTVNTLNGDLDKAKDVLFSLNSQKNEEPVGNEYKMKLGKKRKIDDDESELKSNLNSGLLGCMSHSHIDSNASKDMIINANNYNHSQCQVSLNKQDHSNQANHINKDIVYIIKKASLQLSEEKEGNEEGILKVLFEEIEKNGLISNYDHIQYDDKENYYRIKYINKNLTQFIIELLKKMDSIEENRHMNERLSYEISKLNEVKYKLKSMNSILKENIKNKEIEMKNCFLSKNMIVK